MTAIFCDVVGSTALGESVDPETLRELLGKYFQRMKAIIEAHGGTVEKFVGDAVMAVFGVPAAHEDDALRACRAAVEMREAFPELRIEGRIGVNTGEVVAGTEERLATGDAINVAARLEQAAQPGELLIGTETLRLVRAAVEVGEPRQLDLKGKSELLSAWPLLAVPGELERPFATPMVGRRRELRRLGDAYAQAVHDRSCQLFTVLGSAGVGKSRLAAEFLTGLEARLVRGRSLSYGEGITYWPVVEILKQLGHLPEGDAARPLRSLLSESHEVASAEEIAWGFRKLLEQEAQEKPLVCVFDDLHWAEQTLLDLVEHAADLSRDAPILILCMARPELLERRPSWGGGKWNATTILLEPLDAAETDELLSELGSVPEELRSRIVRIAEGNPLFVEEMLALVRDSPDGTAEVPPTIQALLAARLDQLDPEERAVLERGSVEGRIFHRGAVAALTDGDDGVDQRLLALVRKELVRPDRTQLAGDDAYRFRHLLIRDAAYDALPKSVRADLHRRFAAWLETHGQGLVELNEILGYHLEQAARYLAELGRGDPELAHQAAERLGRAGRRALWRGDDRAAAPLLERALELTRPQQLDVSLELDLAVAVARSDQERASAIAAAAADCAAKLGDDAAESIARVVAANYGARVSASGADIDELERLAKAALPAAEQRQDHSGCVHIWTALSEVTNFWGRVEERGDAAERALFHARSAGRRPAHVFSLDTALVSGPTPADAALRRLDTLLPQSPHPRSLLFRAVLLTMLARFDEAKQLADEAGTRLHELTGGDEDALPLAEMARLLDDHAAAAEELQRYCTFLRGRGRWAALSTYAPMLGRERCALGQYADAEQLAEEGRVLGDEQDVMTQALWRQTQALVDTHRGNHVDSERLAREAVALTQTTDAPWSQGDALADLARVLEAGGRPEEAAAALREALERYEAKGIVPLAGRTRERLTALQAS